MFNVRRIWLRSARSNGSPRKFDNNLLWFLRKNVYQLMWSKLLFICPDNNHCILLQCNWNLQLKTGGVVAMRKRWTKINNISHSRNYVVNIVNITIIYFMKKYVHKFHAMEKQIFLLNSIITFFVSLSFSIFFVPISYLELKLYVAFHIIRHKYLKYLFKCKIPIYVKILLYF